MASIQDSEAHFKARAEEYGLDGATSTLLDGHGISADQAKKLMSRSSMIGRSH